MWAGSYMRACRKQTGSRCSDADCQRRAGLFGQPLLRHRACLIDRQFPVLLQGELAALAGVRAVLEHEHLAARWCNLAQEAGHQRVPQFDGLRLGLCRIHCGLGELDFCHDDSSERPGFQGPHGSHEAGSRIRFQKAPAYDERA